MRKPYIRGGMKILNNQQGNVLLLGVFMILVIMMLFAGAVEFGRLMIVREQLQTAADSAALAGAGSGTHRYVKINVTTDRGLYQPECSEKSCPPCSSCGTVTISGIVGNEKDLIDGAGWQEFCVPPCDCSPGDCWFSLAERQLMYDTQSMEWGTAKEEIDNAEKEITKSMQTVLPKYSLGYEQYIASMVSGLTLQQMSDMLGDINIWLPKWMAAGGWNSSGCYYRNYTCNQWRQQGYTVFQKYNPKKEMIDNIIQSFKNIRETNNKKVNKVAEQYTEASERFFEVNLPTNTVQSQITKRKVYGFENQKSPYYPSVVIYASSKIKTLFPQWFGNSLTTNVCAQGTTQYRDYSDQISIYGDKIKTSLTKGKWNRVPKEACWVDL